MFIPPPHSQASALAIELGNKIYALIHDFRQSHPGTGDRDVRQALQLAMTQTGAGIPRQLVAVLVAGLLLAAGVAAFVLRMGPGAAPQGMIALIIAGLVLAVLIIKFAAKR